MGRPQSYLSSRATERDVNYSFVKLGRPRLDHLRQTSFVSVFSLSRPHVTQIPRFVALIALIGASLVPRASIRAQAAQARVCKSVDLSRIGPTGYTNRGTRCEGILEREVGGEVVPVVGLAAYVGAVDPQRGIDFTLGFARSSTDSVWIVASSVSPRLHYRMDTAVPTNVDQIKWPVSILRAEGIRRNDIAVLAWTRLPGVAADRVYLPVSLTQSTAAPAGRSAPVLTMLPAKRLRGIRVSVAETDSLGRPSRWIKENEPIPGSDFIEGLPVTIQLPALQPLRLYRVQIGAFLAPETKSMKDSLTTTTALLLRAP
jgi:hypothetical protein